jgi:hypothetical protein
MSDTPTHECIQCWTLVERLIADEASSVTLLCENPEGIGPDNYAVDVSAEWTGWEEERFEGRTRLECLRKAIAAMEKARSEGLRAEVADTLAGMEQCEAGWPKEEKF